MKDFLKLNQGEVGIECRFATYVKPPEAGLPDLHLVKEQVHKADGTVVPVVKPVYNYERPYWIVKKGYRNFNQPKEWIEKERVNEFYSTQTDLLYKAASSLGKPYFKKSIKDLAAEPSSGAPAGRMPDRTRRGKRLRSGSGAPSW